MTEQIDPNERPRPFDTRDGVDGDATRHLTLRAEEASVFTERVATGLVSFRKRIVTEETTVPVTLRREELDVVEQALDDPHSAQEDEVAGGTPGAGSDAAPGAADVETRADVRRDGEDLEIILYAERPVVTTEVVAVERIRIRKGVVTETQRVEVELAREEGVVEDVPVERPRD